MSTSVESAKIKKQVEYYLSDGNLRMDEFFHNKISADKEVPTAPPPHADN
jgi:hypothetical protein